MISEASQKMDEFEDALNCGKLDLAGRIFQEMKKLFGKDNPFVVEVQAGYDLETL